MIYSCLCLRLCKHRDKWVLLAMPCSFLSTTLVAKVVVVKNNCDLVSVFDKSQFFRSSSELQFLFCFSPGLTRWKSVKKFSSSSQFSTLPESGLVDDGARVRRPRQGRRDVRELDQPGKWINKSNLYQNRFWFTSRRGPQSSPLQSSPSPGPARLLPARYGWD